MIETLVVEPRLIKNQSAALKQYVSLLIRLHEAMRGDDEEEAERIREQMDVPGSLLNENEIKLVKGVSSDLYMLSGEEVLRPSGYSKNELSTRLVDAYKSRDADTVLTFLRKTERPDSPSGLAYTRYIVYGWLGLEEVSRVFLLHASELDPQHIGYRVNLLVELGDMSQASPIRALASSVFSDPNASPFSILMAAGALFFMSKDASTNAARTDLGQAWRKIRELFEAASPKELSPEGATLGLVLLGAISEALGRKSKARGAFEEATKINVRNAVPWEMLGISWFRDDPIKAEPYLKRAVELDTKNPFPYLALAKQAIEHGDYSEGRKLSEKILEMIQESGGPANSPRLSAQVYEFLGLVEGEQNGPTEVAVSYLKEAARLDPENERIQASYTDLLREAETKDLETSHLAERHRRLLEWSNALQRDTPTSTSMLLPTLQRPSENMGSPWSLAAAA